ncbi:hypothetical protein [Pedobacter sp.]|uniref:hypothetical protein n=1 Tax=Pedobacter sp. TaxID=1411316 RepID=UPI00396C9D61
MRVLTWTKNVFDSNYQLFSDNQIIGNLVFNMWQHSATGLFENQTFFFKSSGFLGLDTQIFDINHQPLGKIQVHGFALNATVELANGEKYLWHANSMFLNSWQLGASQDKLVKCNGASGSGFITEQNIDQSFVLLAGLFIKETFAKMFFFIIMLIFIWFCLYKF